MSTLNPLPSIELTSDADLVAICLSGDRNAFGRIVERYQRLLCSLAYSATGQLSQSEDLAQEAFVEAWRQLGNLREPEKLRPWLCGILRYKVSRLRRSDGREPVTQASSIDEAGDLPSSDEPTADRAIEKEEQAIMWSALERVPELYREPLVLYYREHRSVEHVAAALDLTEDNVKQRLARGRKILQEQVLAFVEGALTRSTPGRVFTLGVLAALPEITTPVKAMGIGAAAAHGGMLAKTTSIAALLASLSGVATTIMTLRASLDQARTPRERRAVVKATIGCVLGSVGLLVILYALRASAFRWWDHRVIFATIAGALAVIFIVAWPLGLSQVMRNARALRTSERKQHPECFRDPKDHVGSAAGEYRSKAKFLGVPWVHFRFSSPDEGERPVFGWIAAGDRAYGLLFAWGGIAIAPISIGAFSVGLLSIGALGVGVIGLGTFGVGLFAMGAVSVGVKAFAWLTALGWETAQSGGFAIARIAAEGPVALALHANDPIAREFLANPDAERNQSLFIIVMVLFSLVPLAYYARAVRQRLGKKAAR
jgi:RNA polymerase sigma factor (sigma-70 family)